MLQNLLSKLENATYENGGKSMNKKNISVGQEPTLGINKYYRLLEIWHSKGMGIDDFEGWLIEDGMGYKKDHGTKEWWNREKSKERINPHEGVDFCWYKGKEVQQVKHGQSIPLISDGILDGIVKDFLGHTFLFRTSFTDEDQRPLYIAYAHSSENKGIELEIGKSYKKDDELLVIAESQYKTPSHLHLSIFWAKKGFKLQTFDWTTVNVETSILEFINPLPPNIELKLYSP